MGKTVHIHIHTRKVKDTLPTVGQKVNVQTVKGVVPGVVKKMDETHIGVQHEGVNGLVWYLPQYVKAA